MSNRGFGMVARFISAAGGCRTEIGPWPIAQQAVAAPGGIAARPSPRGIAATLGIALAAVLAPVTHAAAASDAAFTIANYPVDAIDTNAVRAKEKALADGQQAAFRSLLRRLVPVTAYRRLVKLTPKPGEMIDGVAVRSERNSSTEYIASLDFSFQPQAVRNFLQREGLPFVDTQAADVIVVPVLRNGEGASIDVGPWSDAWKGLDLAHALAPVKIEPLKDAVHPDTVKMALSGDGGADRILAGEYHSDRVILAVADLDLASRRINVVFSGRDAVGPFHLKRSWRLNGDRAYALEFAAVVGLGVLEGRWKATQTLAPTASWTPPRGGYAGAGTIGQIVEIEAQFSSQAEWNDIRRHLLETPGVDGVAIGTMTARSASIRLTYPGGGDKLAQSLSAQGFDMRNLGGTWNLKSGF